MIYFCWKHIIQISISVFLSLRILRLICMGIFFVALVFIKISPKEPRISKFTDALWILSFLWRFMTCLRLYCSDTSFFPRQLTDFGASAACESQKLDKSKLFGFLRGDYFLWLWKMLHNYVHRCHSLAVSCNLWIVLVRVLMRLIYFSYTQQSMNQFMQNGQQNVVPYVDGLRTGITIKL